MFGKTDLLLKIYVLRSTAKSKMYGVLLVFMEDV